MQLKRPLTEQDLAALAKRFRQHVGIRRAQAARDMGVAQASIFAAEEDPTQSLHGLRVRMIETYSPYKVVTTTVLVRK